jgi:CDP-4-dehydro-6-deoxyglucose reductase
MANAPHTQGDKPAIELHLRHLPGGLFTDHVFSAMKEKDILRIEGPFGSFFLREDSDQADGAARVRDRPRADQGDRRAPALEAQRPSCSSVLGLPHPQRPLPARMGGRPRAEMPSLTYIPVLSEATDADAGPAAPAWSTRR